MMIVRMGQQLIQYTMHDISQSILVAGIGCLNEDRDHSCFVFSEEFGSNRNESGLCEKGCGIRILVL